MPGPPHVCTVLSVGYIILFRAWRGGGRGEENDREREKITTIHTRRVNPNTQYYILLWAKNQLVCQASATGWYTRFPSFLFFIFILPIAIFIDAHVRRRRHLVHYTLAARNTRGPFRVVCLRCSRKRR